MKRTDPSIEGRSDHIELLVGWLRDTIATSVEGIGGRVQMGVVRAGGTEMASEADMRALSDTVDLWEARCAELLLGGTAAAPAASETPDRGVRPPAG